jgi:hypothetical protein|nr:MAG TPA: protein of unknown function (DUF3560) [Caudoviricetes sp.]
MKYYSINEELARRSHDMMSMSDYKKGSATAEYQRMVDKACDIAESQKRRVDSMYHDKIDALLDSYARRLADNINNSNRIGTMCPSILIAGGSGFNVRKKERQNAAADRNMQEWNEIQCILHKIRSVGTGGISGDDPNALNKLRAKLESLERLQNRMKAANSAIRMKDQAKGDAKLAEMGYSPSDIKELRSPDFCGRIGYPSYQLSNNNANIRRIRDRIEELEKRQDSPAPEGWKFGGGKVVINAELNRLQIVLDDCPDADTKQALKSHGFRWAPSQGAWQRQLTDNAIHAAKAITRAE